MCALPSMKKVRYLNYQLPAKSVFPSSISEEVLSLWAKLEIRFWKTLISWMEFYRNKFGIGACPPYRPASLLDSLISMGVILSAMSGFGIGILIRFLLNLRH